MLLPKKFSSFRDNLDAERHLEMITVKNAKSQKRLTVLYKDHSMPKNEFLSRMKNVFLNHKKTDSIIMGDFNINMKEDFSLEAVASAEGFYPIVRCGTTIHDSLLDQIFINFSKPSNWEVVSLQSYFSDHNLIVVCMKRHSKRNIQP